MNFESENLPEPSFAPESQTPATPTFQPPDEAPQEKALDSVIAEPHEAPPPPESPEATSSDLPADTTSAASAITGRVRNAPAGIHLKLIGEATHLTTALGRDGVYSFNHLPAGTFTLFLDGVGVVNPSLILDGKSEIVFDYSVRPQPKAFDHYLLFGPGGQSATLTHLILALDYIVRFAPLVGFSPEEAGHARAVTIVGDTGAVSDAAEQELHQAGCHVVRLTAPDSYALENLFKQLVASGSPFPR